MTSVMCKHCDNHHHEHEHHHEHHHEHSSSISHQLIKVALASLLLVVACVLERNFDLPMWQRLVIYLIPYLIVGYETIHEAVEGLMGSDFMNEHFLMTIATVGALSIGFLPGGEPEFAEAVFVMLFFQIGEMFESYAEGQSKRSISHLMEIRPDTASVEREGEVVVVSPSEVSIGETIVVKPGERVPLDGTIVFGSSALNMVALTGESVPRDVIEGDAVVSGCINLSGVLRIRTSCEYGDSTVAKILNMVESAAERKSKTETFIARFAKIYTPIVVVLALLIALVSPAISAISHQPAEITPWIYKALTFLIVSCPCALVISVPLTFFAGMGGASRKGILVKGSNYLDLLSRLSTVVFDKTGTLTRGQFAVTAVHPEEIDEEHLLHLAAHVEHFTTHPIGAALREAFPKESTDGCAVTDVQEIAGHGVSARVRLADGKTEHVVCVGNSKMMERVGAEWHPCHHTGSIIHIAIDGSYAGHIVINDQLKEDSRETIDNLMQLGIEKTVMLTGDSREVAENVAGQLGITSYYSELLPADKVEKMEELVGLQSAKDKNYIAFVGDGINDAPVLARADVGIAMGALGSDAAIEAADVVLMDDKPSKIAAAIRIARKTIAIARQNVVFAIGIKVAVLVLAVFGLSTLGMAVFADVGVTVLAVLNAMRAMRC